MPETKEQKPKSPVQILISRVDNMRNDFALLRNRVENVEKSVVSLKDYIKDQFIELYSQIESARESMDEITAFFEEMNREEEESDDVTDREMDLEEVDGDEGIYDEELNDESTLPSDDDGLELEFDSEE